jgi:uncharacterized damage-inducible protein DinB
VKNLKIISFITLNIAMHNYIMAQSYFKTEYPAVWQRAKLYILEVTAAMPADLFAFKPIEESMTFHQQLIHIVQNLAFLSSQITDDSQDFFHGNSTDSLSKEELTAVLQKSFNYVSKLIEEIDDQTLHENIDFGGEKMTKENIFYLMRDHTAHHRAQAILYLRMNGIDTPKYRGW